MTPWHADAATCTRVLILRCTANTQVMSTGYDEVESLVQAATGAAAVVVFDHTRRSDDGTKRSSTVVREPAPHPHCDYTSVSGPRRLRDAAEQGVLHQRGLDVDVDVLLRSPWCIINVWRGSTGTTVDRAPLAL